MVSFTSVVALAAYASVALGQAAPNASFPPSDIQSLLDDTSITAGIRESWCVSQRTSCSTLCGGDATQTCVSSTLTANCTCNSNSSAPALQYYENTLVWNECTKLNGNCMATNANDLAAQTACNATYVCGSQNISDFTGASAASSSSAAPSTASATGSASSTGSAAAATSTGAAIALRIGESYGAGILGAGLLAALGLIF